MGATVVIDDTFWVARGARRVVQRYCVPFIVGHLPCKFRISLGDEFFVLDRPQTFASTAIFGVIIVDDQRFYLAQRKGFFHDLGKLAIDDHHLCVGVIEGERDRKSTRLNSSHMSISYAVFCLKKKK